MIPVIYRPMAPEDVSQAVTIENQIFSRPWTKENFLDSLSLKDAIFLVAQREDSKEIVGYCGCYQSLDEGNITNVAVIEAVRRQGIARGLLSSVIDEGQRRGICNFFLEVRVSNLAAITLYEKLGFRTAGIRKDFYVAPVENAWVMVWST